MHSAAKLIIGIIVFLAGIYWYLPGNAAAPALGVHSTYRAFLTVFAGLFGLFLLILGLIVAWIEYEDLKWERKEKNAPRPAITQEKMPAKASRK
ncbi:MAG TPA: hypothetical protein VI968_00250 [archaeon]|nr:hypothetical protein [archaeon]